MAPAIAAGSSGGTSRQTPATASTKALPSDTIGSSPRQAASSAGIPKPSRWLGSTKASAAS